MLDNLGFIINMDTYVTLSILSASSAKSSPHLMKDIMLPLECLRISIDFFVVYFFMRASQKIGVKIKYLLAIFSIAVVFSLLILLAIYSQEHRLALYKLFIFEYLITFLFLYSIYALISARAIGVILFFAGNIITTVYDYMLLTLPGIMELQGYNSVFILKYIGAIIVYLGVLMLVNNQKNKPSNYFYRQNSLNVQLSVWATLISLLLALLFIILPAWLSLETPYVVKLDPDLKVFLPSVLVIFMLLTILVYKGIAAYTIEPLNNMIAVIRKFRSGKFTDQITYKHYPVKEYNFLEKYVNKSLFEIKTRNDKIKQSSDLAGQVFHDIQSPLNTIRLIISNEINDKREIHALNKSIDAIKDSSTTLLKHGARGEKTIITGQNVKVLTEEVIQAKKIEYHARPVRFEFISLVDKINNTANFDPIHFKSALSNIINNAVESIENQGTVTVNYSYNSDNHIVTIEDTGKGIPEEIITQLGKKQLSYKKSFGKGLGMLSVDTFLQNCGGKFTIESTLGQGTKITLYIPVTEQSHVFVDTLYLIEGGNVIIIDDDPVYENIWKEILKSSNQLEKINLEYFDSPEHAPEGVLAENLYLVDNRFSNADITGIEYIEQKQIVANSYLCTSSAISAVEYDKCATDNISIIAKNNIWEVDVKLIDPECEVLVVDDDANLLLALEMKYNGSGIKLVGLSHPMKLFYVMHHINRSATVILDQTLKNVSFDGVYLARQLFSHGFRNIYLSTGHDASLFPEIKEVRAILSKEYTISKAPNGEIIIR